MDEQKRFFGQFGGMLAQLASALDNIETLRRVAMARGYDQWEDADLSETGYDKNDLLTLLYFADDMRAFMNGGEVAANDRQPIVDRFRADM